MGLIIEGIKSLTKLLGDGFYGQHDIDYFNNRMVLAYEQCIDYVNCHYSKSNIESPFWDYVRKNFVMSKSQEFCIKELSSDNKTIMTGGKGFIFGNSNWVHWLIQAGYDINPKTWIAHDKIEESLQHLIWCEDRKIELGKDLIKHYEFCQ